MAKSVVISQVLKHLEEFAPSGTAETWDQVGLLVGSASWKTSGAVVSVDLTREALTQAQRDQSRLIVIHHPCIFPKNRGLSRVISGDDDSLSTLMVEALREGISIVSCHTNFDRCALEVVASVSKGLGAKPHGRLFETGSASLMKLVVFVPETHVEGVRNALCQAGAGVIGNYDYCTFGTRGLGTFRGLEGTTPFLGERGKLESVDEVRLETIFPRGMQQPVLRALLVSHPYEEVAYDLYSVDQKPPEMGLVRGLGYGFWGEFERSLSFSELTKRVKALFGVKGFIFSGKPPKRVERIAFAAGKGASFLDHAAALDCDLMITGEAGYHSSIGAARNGMSVIELGHRESECFFAPTLSQWLKGLGLRTRVSDSPIQRILC